MRSTRLFVTLVAAVLGTAASAGEQSAARLTQGAHEARVGDVTLHYVVAGHGKPVLVPSPSWGPGSLYLQRGLQPLEADHLVIFVDSRGSGLSSHPADERRMAMDDMADDIEAMRRYLGLARFDLIGHSGAGEAAIQYAERFHGHLDGLVLVDAATYGTSADDEAEGKAADQDRARLAKDTRYAAAVDHMIHDPFPPPSNAAMMQRLMDTGALDFANPASAGPRFAATIKGMTPSAFAWRTSSAADRAHPLEQERKLGQIKARTMIVHGKQDWLVPVLTAEHVHRGIARSTLLELDNCGHFPWIEQPATFFAGVKRFLAG